MHLKRAFDSNVGQERGVTNFGKRKFEKKKKINSLIFLLEYRLDLNSVLRKKDSPLNDVRVVE